MLKSPSAIIMTGIFSCVACLPWWTRQGLRVFTNEALSKQIQASFEEGKREAFWSLSSTVIVDAILGFCVRAPFSKR